MSASIIPYERNTLHEIAKSILGSTFIKQPSRWQYWIPLLTMTFTAMLITAMMFSKSEAKNERQKKP
jgi:hypothetical protein